ncbi:hypothetical protein [Geitlerinema sp. PCC 9228]|jgi:hypothetical protein|uniref:hypothetical protein n=1 Tax=Geitlerinema sp. PCC 9228 TaxID=111611 RepID=UPI0008F99E21|nr:hypothetical protein [Geitlerinema sp. PCC 9228]
MHKYQLFGFLPQKWWQQPLVLVGQLTSSQPTIKVISQNRHGVKWGCWLLAGMLVVALGIGMVLPTPAGLAATTVTETPAATASEPETKAKTLTPEQSLMLAIQDDLDRAIQRYGQGLVESVRANLDKDWLQVTVASDWYQLESDRQNQFAQSILEQSQKLTFRRLDMVDPKGKEVAYNATSGEGIIILRR